MERDTYVGGVEMETVIVFVFVDTHPPLPTQPFGASNSRRLRIRNSFLHQRPPRPKLTPPTNIFASSNSDSIRHHGRSFSKEVTHFTPSTLTSQSPKRHWPT